MNYLFPLIACLLWGANTVVTKVAANAVGPVDISFFRWVMAIFVLAPFGLPAVLRNGPAIRANLPRFFVLGCLGGVIYQCTAYYAAHFTTATNMGVIQALIPMIALALSRIFLGHRITASSIVGAVISAVGVMLVVSRGDFAGLVSHGLNRGDVFMLLGASAFATYNLLTHHWKLPVRLAESLFLQAVTASVVLLPFWVLFGHGASGAVAFGCIAFAGIGASVAAPLTWMIGIARLGVSRVSGFFNLVPVITALLAIVVLPERLSVWAVAGGLLAVLGVVVAEYAARRKPEPVMSASGHE